MARKRERPEILSVPVPREILQEMPRMEEAPLRAILFLCLHEQLSDELPALADVREVSRGTGLSAARVRAALVDLESWRLVARARDGRYCLAGDVPPAFPKEQGRRGGSKRTHAPRGAGVTV